MQMHITPSLTPPFSIKSFNCPNNKGTNAQKLSLLKKILWHHLTEMFQLTLIVSTMNQVQGSLDILHN